MPPVFVLVHSPLVGPLTWSLVAERLPQHGLDVLAPVLQDKEVSGTPFWLTHVESVVAALQRVPANQPLVLIGHSGAGPLLPAIARTARHPVAAYIFVDAGLPRDGVSRLGEMEADAPEFAHQLRAQLAAGGRFPEWSDQELREVLPDDTMRARMIAELRPRSLAFFEEPLPGFAPGFDAPCGYLQFSGAYTVPAQRAQEAGWAFRVLDAGHFHMLVDPDAVAGALIAMAQEMAVL